MAPLANHFDQILVIRHEPRQIVQSCPILSTVSVALPGKVMAGTTAEKRMAGRQVQLAATPATSR
jgi:hypothetical protein